MNPTIKAERLDRERRLDPSRFAREYEAEFSEDVDSFLPGAWVEQAVVSDRHELAAQPGMKYVAACDTSGGGADTFSMAIVHSQTQNSEQKIVQNVMKGWNRSKSGTMDLEGTVKQIAEILKRYKLDEITGDKYAAGWVRERFQAESLRYQDAEIDKSQVYLEVEPLFAQGRIEILDHSQLIRELKILERRPRAGGKTLVDHPSGKHDDYSNALCLAAYKAMSKSGCGIPRFTSAGKLSHTKTDAYAGVGGSWNGLRGY
jgi:hypothetical protein